MSDNSDLEQRSLFDPNFDANPPVTRWQIETAKNRLPEYVKELTELEKLIQNIICPENFSIADISDLLATRNLSREEALKIQICFLIAHEEKVTIAQLYNFLGESIHGTKRMEWGDNRFVWDNLSKEGIKVILDLIEAEWIIGVPIDHNLFLTKSALSKSPFPSLQIADISLSWSFYRYAKPHWLPLAFTPGLKLIAFKSVDDQKVQELVQSFEVELDFPNKQLGDLAEVSIFPDEINSTNSFKEGSICKITVNAYERNSQVRQKCIDYYGTHCCVCSLDLGEKYGEIGKGVIHVHHNTPSF